VSDYDSSIERVTIRRLLRKHLRLETEFDAFMIDNYPDLKSRLSGTMDRVAKENILLEAIDNRTVLINRLQQWHQNLTTTDIHSEKLPAISATPVDATNRVHNLQKWTVKISLLSVTAQILFFLVAPLLGFPMEQSQTIRILEIFLPVFLCYLSTATLVLFRSRHSFLLMSTASKQFLSLLVRGPMIMFGVASCAAICAFWYSNRSSAPIGTGMSIDMLAAVMSLCLGILIISNNAIVAFLFSLPGEEDI